jgi:hypothetical protein
VVYIIVLCRQCDFRLFLIRPCAPPPYASCVHGSCLRGSAPIIDTDNSGIAQQTRYSLSHVNLNCAHYGASLDIDNISFINMDELELAIPCVPITNLIGSNACTLQWFPSNARRAVRTSATAHRARWFAAASWLQLLRGPAVGGHVCQRHCQCLCPPLHRVLQRANGRKVRASEQRAATLRAHSRRPPSRACSCGARCHGPVTTTSTTAARDSARSTATVARCSTVSEEASEAKGYKIKLFRWLDIVSNLSYFVWQLCRLNWRTISDTILTSRNRQM